MRAFRCSIAIALLAVVTGCGAKPVVLNVADFGAKNDGVTLNTVAIQTAIDQCTAHGGGTVRLPAGTFLTGTIPLKDNVTLHLDDKTILKGSSNPEDYRNLDPFFDGSGTKMGYALFVAKNATHIAIEGHGTIDGRGKLVKAAQKKFEVRPFLLRWIGCKDIAIRNVHLINPGAWTLKFLPMQ